MSPCDAELCHFSGHLKMMSPPSLGSEQSSVRSGLLPPGGGGSGEPGERDLPADCSSLAMMMAVRAASRYCFRAMYRRNRYLAS